MRIKEETGLQATGEPSRKSELYSNQFHHATFAFAFVLDPPLEGLRDEKD